MAVFLLYRNQGERRYGQRPIFPYPRGTWEFQFILSGSCFRVIRENDVNRDERFLGPMLSLTGPDCHHGWNGKDTDVCHAIIFHFDEVDFAVRSIVGTNGCRKVRFAKEEIPHLQSLYERCAEVRRAIGTTPDEVIKRAGFLEPLTYSIVAAELNLFFLKHVPKSELGTTPYFSERKVREALAWYEAKLSSNPTMAEVAQAVHISPTHLRRLFHKIRGASPQEAFTEIQFKRVKWLMRDSSITFEQISEICGFGSASAFSRAFSKKFGISPKQYRQTLKS